MGNWSNSKYIAAIILEIRNYGNKKEYTVDW